MLAELWRVAFCFLLLFVCLGVFLCFFVLACLVLFVFFVVVVFNKVQTLQTHNTLKCLHTPFNHGGNQEKDLCVTCVLITSDKSLSRGKLCLLNYA